MALRHAASAEKVHLPPLASIPAGRQAIALVKTDRFEAIHLVLQSGGAIAPHTVDGYLTLHCLEGAVTLEAGGRSIALESGDWLYLRPGERHGLSAAEDSSLLLTILFEQSGVRAAP